jgi:hypothetical protein
VALCHGLVHGYVPVVQGGHQPGVCLLTVLQPALSVLTLPLVLAILLLAGPPYFLALALTIESSDAGSPHAKSVEEVLNVTARTG